MRFCNFNFIPFFLSCQYFFASFLLFFKNNLRFYN
nr:MAG TPA: hypothetical protein [Caudoviricetes sp.]